MMDKLAAREVWSKSAAKSMLAHARNTWEVSARKSSLGGWWSTNRDDPSSWQVLRLLIEHWSFLYIRLIACGRH